MPRTGIGSQLRLFSAEKLFVTQPVFDQLMLCNPSTRNSFFKSKTIVINKKDNISQHEDNIKFTTSAKTCGKLHKFVPRMIGTFIVFKQRIISMFFFSSMKK